MLPDGWRNDRARDMHEVDWTTEPDLDALRTAHGQLKTDPERAIKALEGLAARGSRMSMWYLVHAFICSSNIPRDLVRSRHWYQQAAGGGDVLFLHWVGRVSFDLEDWDAAIAAFSEASARDYPPSQYWLGSMYRDGKGVPTDIDKTKALYEQATAAGHLFAKRDLAVLYMRGKFWVAKISRGIALMLSLAKDLVLIRSKSMEELRERIT